MNLDGLDRELISKIKKKKYYVTILLPAKS